MMMLYCPATVVVYAQVQRQGRRHPVVGMGGVRGTDDDNDDDSAVPELPPKLDTTQPAAAEPPVFTPSIIPQSSGIVYIARSHSFIDAVMRGDIDTVAG